VCVAVEPDECASDGDPSGRRSRAASAEEEACARGSVRLRSTTVTLEGEEEEGILAAGPVARVREPGERSCRWL
jgi:hypothetical protein